MLLSDPPSPCGFVCEPGGPYGAYSGQASDLRYWKRDRWDEEIEQMMRVRGSFRVAFASFELMALCGCAFSIVRCWCEPVLLLCQRRLLRARV